MQDTPDPAPLAPALRHLADAIRAHPGRVQTALCGFDLWLLVMGSGHTSMADFCPGGRPPGPDEPEGTLRIPVLVIGARIVISLDTTLPPDGFELRA